jgi:hypothetical protein
MKRWRRWLFNLAAGVSVVLCLVSIVGVWMRSYWRYDLIEYVTEGNSWAVHWTRGSVGVTSTRPWAGADHFSHRSFPSNSPRLFVDGTPGAFTFAGFGYVDDRTGTISQWTMYVPCWFLAVLLISVLAVVSSPLRYPRRRRWAQQDRCVSCGYDLRATPDRRPECGAVPAAVKGTATRSLQT